MEAKLDQFVRTKASENSEQLAEIRKKITEQVEALFNAEVKALKEENQYLRQEELVFREKAFEIAKQAFINRSLVGVSTQTGHNGSLIREYVGHVEKLYDASSCFNLVDKNVYEGKPFTIGMSCLLSIKIL